MTVPGLLSFCLINAAVLDSGYLLPFGGILHHKMERVRAACALRSEGSNVNWMAPVSSFIEVVECDSARKRNGFISERGGY
jgi:hypothetical protein